MPVAVLIQLTDEAAGDAWWAMAHTNPANSRAAATQILLTSTPRDDSRAKRAHKRICAFQAWLRTTSGTELLRSRKLRLRA